MSVIARLSYAQLCAPIFTLLYPVILGLVNVIDAKVSRELSRVVKATRILLLAIGGVAMPSIFSPVSVRAMHVKRVHIIVLRKQTEELATVLLHKPSIPLLHVIRVVNTLRTHLVLGLSCILRKVVFVAELAADITGLEIRQRIHKLFFSSLHLLRGP